MDSILPDSPQSKQCFKCKQWFPVTSDYFTKHPQKKDGWNPSCKACKNGKPFPVKDVVPEGMKRCSKCKQIQPATNEYFARTKDTKDGFVSHCKTCVRDYAQTYNDTHKEEHAQYRQEHKEHINEANKQRYELHREEIRAAQNQYRDIHKDGINERRRRLRREDPVARERMREHQRQSQARHRDAIRARVRIYRSIHRERIEAMRRQRYHLHKDKRSAYQKQYRQTHADAIREQKIRWYKTEQGHLKVRASRHRREARQKMVEGTLTSDQIQEKLKAQKYRCYYAACGHAKFKKKNGKYIYHIEHTVPISRTEHNPRHDVNYVVLACPSCNLSKNNKLPHEWSEGGRLF